ncbi:MAG: metallophosphoesterase, partial [Spirochaetaceae bacterium]
SMDGSVTLFYGTHTHIQTADERIFPKGTAYITDIGATGAEDSVIGFDPQISITRSISQVPHKNTVLDAPAMLQGVFVIADADSGKALHVERVREVSGV